MLEGMDLPSWADASKGRVAGIIIAESMENSSRRVVDILSPFCANQTSRASTVVATISEHANGKPSHQNFAGWNFRNKAEQV